MHIRFSLQSSAEIGEIRRQVAGIDELIVFVNEQEAIAGSIPFPSKMFVRESGDG